jgi:ribosome biogenesis protein Nip4
MRLAISVARPNLVSLGTCFGKFSKSGKFKLHITALDHLAQYAKHKVGRLILHDSNEKLLTSEALGL